MPTPGAATSTKALRVLNEAMALLLSMAATEMTWSKAAGYEIEPSPLLPAAATRTTPAAAAASKVGWKAATLAADRLAPRLMLMTEAPFATA